MLPKPIAHWILAHVSRETLKWIIGILMLIPMILGPIVVAVAVFVGLRNTKPAPGTGFRLTQIGNLLFASLFFLGLIWPDDWRLLSPPPTPATDAPGRLFLTLVATLICLWFVSALVLFFRSRLAWCGSLLGVGAAIFLSLYVMLEVVKESCFPSPTADVPPSMPALVMATVTMLLFLLAFLAFSVGIFTGLIKSRQELRRM